MKRDYAARAKPNASRRGTSRRAATRKSSTRKPAAAKSRRSGSASLVNFNAPSFSVGLVLGAAAMLLLPQLAELFEPSPDAKPVLEPEQPELIFRYDTLLSHSEVTADTEAYPVEFEDPNAVSDQEFLLQAASFRSFAEAADLQAKLAHQDMPTEVSRVMVRDQPWFRVTVGPYSREIEAQRAVTRLRQNNLAPMYLTRGARRG